MSSFLIEYNTQNQGPPFLEFNGKIKLDDQQSNFRTIFKMG